MDEIVVDDAELVAMRHGVEQLFAHAHQRRGAAGREIEPAEQFEPPRLAGLMQFGGVIGDGRLPPIGDGAVDAGAIVTEGGGERLEKGDPRPGGQVGIFGQDFLRQRDTRGFAAAGQQFLALFDDAGRALMRRLPALALDQCAAAVGDALQHLAEERGVHGFIPSGTHLANDEPG